MNRQPPIDQQEWDRQERARREVRDGVATTTDPVFDQDRVVARALRQAPDAGPPADFARNVALAVEQAPAPETRLEQWLLRGLAVMFAGAALAVVALYGRAWFNGEWFDGQWLKGMGGWLATASAGTTANWLLALFACVVLSWSLDRVRIAATHRR